MTLLKLLSNILSDGFFHNDWKKTNFIPVHKRRNKQLVSNYHPVPLLLICSRTFGKFIFGCNFDF